MRTNYKWFHTDQIPDRGTVAGWDTALRSAPVQRSPNMPKIWICRVGPQDTAIKQGLYPRLFGNSDLGLTEAAPITAPYSYLFCATYDEFNSTDLHMGIHSGLLASAVLASGWDVSFIGCLKKEVDDRDSKTFKRIRKTLEHRYGISFPRQFKPQLAVCCGRGREPYSGRRNLRAIDTLAGEVAFKTRPSQTPAKPNWLYT